MTTGEAPRLSAITAPELAAWTMIANLLLNLDEALLFTDMQDRNRRQNQLDHDLLNRRPSWSERVDIGASALSHLLPQAFWVPAVSKAGVAPRAKRVIYLFMSGAPRSWICMITNTRWKSGLTRTYPNPSGKVSA